MPHYSSPAVPAPLPPAEPNGARAFWAKRSMAQGSSLIDARARFSALEDAKTVLAKARDEGTNDPRIAPLLARVVAMHAEQECALSRCEAFGETLAAAEARFTDAKKRLDAARNAQSRGTADAKEAIRQHHEIIAAEAELTLRNRELHAAQEPAQLPEIGLPRAADDNGTRELARLGRLFGVQLDSSAHRPAVDVIDVAFRQASTATAEEAAWWPLQEILVLRDEAARPFGRNEAKDEAKASRAAFVEALKGVFRDRQAMFERAQRAAR